MKKFSIASTAVFLLTIAFFSVSSPVRASLLAAGPLTGWAWSDTIGWISFNCLTGGPTGDNICANSNYGVNQDANGYLTGWAWSDSVGWISFTPSVNAVGPTCPLSAYDNGDCSARVSTSTGTLGNVYGWARAVVGCPSNIWNGTSCATAGNSWTAITSSADGTKLALTGWNNQIYTSSDSGATWTARGPAIGWHAITSSADGTKLAAGSANGQMYDSYDSGVTWIPSNTQYVWRSVTSSADGTKLYAGNYLGTGSPGSFTISTTSGNVWTANTPLIGTAINSIVSSADGTNLAATQIGPGQISISHDSGATWSLQGPTDTWVSITSSSDGTKLAAVSNTQIYTSSDSGNTWTARGPSSKYWNAITSSADGMKLAAVSPNDQIYISDDAGVTWTGYGPSLPWLAITSSADGTNLAAITSTTGQVYLSSDSGVTWTQVQNAYVSTVNATDWDGWIHLSGSNHPTGDSSGASGVTFATSTGQYVGYAWGDDVAGWINFNPLNSNSTTCNPQISVCGPVSTTTSATANLYINGGSSAVISTSTATTSPTATLSWSTTNAVSCASPISANSASPFGSSAWGGSTGHATSSTANTNIVGPFSSIPVQNPITYTLSCTDANGLVATSTAMLTVTTSGNTLNPLVCAPINNATLCANEGTSTPLSASTVVKTCSPDSLSNKASLCEYQCNSGFHQVGSNICALPTKIQEK